MEGAVLLQHGSTIAGEMDDHFQIKLHDGTKLKQLFLDGELTYWYSVVMVDVGIEQSYVGVIDSLLNVE